MESMTDWAFSWPISARRRVWLAKVRYGRREPGAAGAAGAAVVARAARAAPARAGWKLGGDSRW